MSGLRALAPLILCLLTVACVSVTPGDQYFEAGDFDAALTAYETEGTAHGLYQMAMIHLDQERFDPQRVGALFTQLAREYPDSPYTRIGALWMSNWRERDRLAGEVEKKLAAIATLQRQSADLQQRLEERESEIAAGQEQVRSLTQQIEGLKGQIESLSSELRDRENELDELMRIDLEAEPLDTSLDSDSD